MKVLKSLLAGAVLATGLSASAAVAETTIFYGHAGPARGTIPTALEWFNNRIGELSGGDMKLDIQFGGALFKGNAVAARCNRRRSERLAVARTAQLTPLTVGDRVSGPIL